jgi:radical SAM protein with 4Fe4S-binding SPASM domain
LKTGLSFDIQESNYEEDMSLQMPPGDLSEYLSLGKAKSIVGKNNDAIIIAADTFVVYNNKCLANVFDDPQILIKLWSTVMRSQVLRVLDQRADKCSGCKAWSSCLGGCYLFDLE